MCSSRNQYNTLRAVQHRIGNRAYRALRKLFEQLGCAAERHLRFHGSGGLCPGEHAHQAQRNRCTVPWQLYPHSSNVRCYLRGWLLGYFATSMPVKLVQSPNPSCIILRRIARYFPGRVRASNKASAHASGAQSCIRSEQKVVLCCPPPG